MEVGCVIESIKNKRPKFLVQKIKVMLNWAELVLLKKDKLPKFNDSPEDLIKSPKEIIKFAKSYLLKKDFGCLGLRGILIKRSVIYKSYIINESKKSHKIINDLPQTGWTIIRPNNTDEFCLKWYSLSKTSSTTCSF